VFSGTAELKTSGYTARMTETPDQENARLLAPLLAARAEAAQDVLAALLDGRYEESAQLLQAYQLADLAVRSAEEICRWFDDGVAGDHIVIDSGD
jgi:hypothetical protein